MPWAVRLKPCRSMRPALAMWQRIYKEDHPEVATSLNNLARCLDALDRSDEALPKHEAALTMRQRIYKEDHPDVAQSLNNVGFCLLGLSSPQEALTKFEAALEMNRRIHKGDDPEVARGLNNVACCLYASGCWAEALLKQEAAFEMWQRIYKGDRREVAGSCNNVASCLQALGRPAEALPKREAALAMFQRLHKRGDPDVARALNSVAVCLQALGRSAEAVPIFEAALAVLQRLVEAQPGNEKLSLDLARTHQGIADLLTSTGNSERARENYRKGLQIAESILAVDAGNSGVKKLRLSLRSRLGLEKTEVVVLGVAPECQPHPIPLEKGDVLVRYAGQWITSSDQLMNLIEGKKGTEIELEIRRDGKQLRFKVKEGTLGVQTEDRSIGEQGTG
jgi:tetratricopeptide (TPR) repeat protein